MPELIPAAPGSPEWLAARRQGITATDIVTILGLGSKSAYSLFWNKMGQVPDDPDNDRWRLGRYLEPYVVERWDWDNPGVMEPGGLYRHSERAWQMASPDRVMINNPPRIDAVLEVKTWADADRPNWGRGMVYDEHGPLIHDDQVPATVRAQVLWQMDVMDVATGHVGVVFLPSGEFRSYVLQHDRDTGAMGHPKSFCSICADLELMRAAGEEFMARLRLELPAPDPDTSAATLAAVKARFAKVPDKQAEIDGNLYASWIGAKSVADMEAERARGFESRIREQAGEASVLTVDGQPVARRIVSDAQVKAHTRHQDYIRRVKQGDDDGS